MRQLSIQVTIYKSKPLMVKVRPSTQSLMTHTEQQTIKGPKIDFFKEIGTSYIEDCYL